MGDEKTVKRAIDNAVADVVDASMGGSNGPKAKLFGELIGIVLTQVAAQLSGAGKESDWVDSGKDDSWTRRAEDAEDAISPGAKGMHGLDMNKLREATRAWWRSVQSDPAEVMKAVMRFHPDDNDIPDRYFGMLKDKAQEDAAVEDDISAGIMKFYGGGSPMPPIQPTVEEPLSPPPLSASPELPKSSIETGKPPKPSGDEPPAKRKPSGEETEFDTSHPAHVPGLPAARGL